ncbi:MAG: protein kinase [Planctomycetes bacterium]|nr:protein kinase [Planctomycetota bacterium]
MAEPSTGLCAGTLGERDLLDLLRQFQRLQVTGLLLVDTGGGRAQIHLRQGGLRTAFFGPYNGAGALTRAILAGPGRFQLAAPVADVPRNIVHETGFVLDSIAKVLADAASLAPVVETGPSNPAEATERIAAFHPPQPGDLVGRCRLLEPIGQGMSALVFRAHHQALDLDVVVKVLLAGGARGARLRELTANEARLLARLNHPNIVRLFDFDDQSKHPHLIVEWIDGPSLAGLLRERGRLPPEDVLPVITQVAEALSYAHDTLGLVHCDLKPENILLTTSGQAKLLDLGLAKASLAAAASSKVVSGEVVVGTPSYIAPEQVQGGHAAADQRCDIYALGATLFHCLAGRPPFVDDDPLQLMVRRLHETPPTLSELVPGIDPRLNQVVMAMLARDPAQRLQDYDQVLAGLAAAQEHRSLTDAEEKVIRRRSSFWRAVPQLFKRTGA